MQIQSTAGQENDCGRRTRGQPEKNTSNLISESSIIRTDNAPEGSLRPVRSARVLHYIFVLIIRFNLLQTRKTRRETRCRGNWRGLTPLLWDTTNRAGDSISSTGTVSISGADSLGRGCGNLEKGSVKDDRYLPSSSFV